MLVTEKLPEFMCAACKRGSFDREAVFTLEIMDEHLVEISFPRLALCEAHTRIACRIISEETDFTVLVRCI